MKKSVSDGYLMQLWRQAVLKKWNCRCIFCGNPLIYELECHHIVKRRHKILRWDWRNGVPVCSNIVKGCHGEAHTKAGEIRIMNLLGDRYYKLAEIERVTYKDYLLRHAMTDNDFRREKLSELKEVINGNT